VYTVVYERLELLVVRGMSILEAGSVDNDSTDTLCEIVGSYRCAIKSELDAGFSVTDDELVDESCTDVDWNNDWNFYSLMPALSDARESRDSPDSKDNQ